MQGNDRYDSIPETRRYKSMITRYDPFREALSLRRAMDQLFEQSFVRPNMMSGAAPQLAPMDICETQHGYEVDVALPGVRPEDIELQVDRNTVTLRGHYSHQNEHRNPLTGQSPLQQSQSQTGAPNGGQSIRQPQGRLPRHRQGHTWLLQEIVSRSFERTI